jgi:signal transduction histidine kinase
MFPRWPIPGGHRTLTQPAPYSSTTQTVDAWWISAAVIGIVAAPLCAAAFTIGQVLGFGAWETGVGDAALIGYATAAILLMVRWHFIGDALCMPLGAAAALVGLGVVPATIHEGLNPESVVALRLASGIVLVVLVMGVVRRSEFRADLNPVRLVTLAFVATGLIAVVLSVWPLRMITGATITEIRAWSLSVAFVQLVAAVLLLRTGIERQRRLLVAVAVMILAVLIATVLRVEHPGGIWLDVAAVCLLVGAVELVVTIAGDLRSAIKAVVLHDVRGTRRSEAAEAELHEMRTTIRGRSHDVRNVLNAIDGTLFVLGNQRQSMPDADLDRIITSMRQEVQWLQLVMNDSADDRSYDLSELLHGLVDIRSTGTARVRTGIEPGLIVRGRPDRLAIAVDNLLLNVAVHAPGATASVGARRNTDGRTVEIVVWDDGPGLSVPECARALERGWRGKEAADHPGSGLGLAQVRDLITAEGGEVTLEPVRTVPGSERRGLSVRLQVPFKKAT